jgi:hypothetical protein
VPIAVDPASGTPTVVCDACGELIANRDGTVAWRAPADGVRFLHSGCFGAWESAHESDEMWGTEGLGVWAVYLIENAGYETRTEKDRADVLRGIR